MIAVASDGWSSDGINWRPGSSGAALIDDPKRTLERQLNAPLGSTKVVAVADSADTYHIAVPYVAAEGELSDSDLEKVAGGLADKTANCNESPGAMNTFIQLNL